MTLIEPNSSDPYLLRARQLHQSAMVIDTHIDTTQKLLNPDFNFTVRQEFGHVDLPRLREGGVNAVFLAVWVPGPVEQGVGPQSARKQLQQIHATAAAHPDDLVLARTVQDVHQAKQNNHLALLIGIEGGYLIDDSLDILRDYHRQGAAYLTLTHSFHTSWADSAGVHHDLPPQHGGLTEFGREVIHELNRLGMMVDISHISDDTFWQVVEITTTPLIATHSSCRAVTPHRRNLSDDMMQAIAKTGGVVQINFAAAFLDPKHPPLDPDLVNRFFDDPASLTEPITDHQTPLRWLVDHFDHAINLIGADHVGIGTDFDGVPTLPVGMDNCSMLPNLTAELLKRGHTENTLTNMLGNNALRVMEACQQNASA